MSDCTCDGPGFCQPRGLTVSDIGYRICKRGDTRCVAAYFGSGAGGVVSSTVPTPQATRVGTCVHRGLPVIDANGSQSTRVCDSCRGTVRLKLWECDHVLHAANPVTTERDCKTCKDWTTTRGPVARYQPMHTPTTLPVHMVTPSQRRPGIWRGGIIQVMVTRACDLACHHCTQGSNLAGKPVIMTPDEFDQALASLEGYWGVVGMFGGNPATHPQFDTLCEIMRARVPFQQRGLWCNNLRGKGAVARITFNPAHSNINVHLDSDAAAEFRRDWPESAPYVRGESEDSVHGPPFVAMRDVIPDEAERWALIGNCDINKHWSAALGVVPGRGLRAFFCEIAYAQAALHATNLDWCGTGEPMPDTGLQPVPGWWRRPLADFESQVRTHCHACGIPLRRQGQAAVHGEHEEFSETHQHIARPKVRDRPMQLVQIAWPDPVTSRPATEYLPGVTPGFQRG